MQNKLNFLNSKVYFFLILFALIAYCFGESIRIINIFPSTNRSLGGASQILLILFVFLFIKKINLFYFKSYIYYGLFYATFSFSVIVNSFNTSALVELTLNAFYFVLFFSILHSNLDYYQIKKIIIYFLSISGLVGTFNLIDYFGFVEFYELNRNQSSTYILDHAILNSTSFFLSRTQYANLLLILFALSIGYILIAENYKERSYGILLLILHGLLGILTISKGFILVCFILIFFVIFSFIKRYRVYSFLLLILLLFIILYFLLLLDKLDYSDFQRISSSFHLYNNFNIFMIGDGLNELVVEYIGRKGQHVAFLALINKSGILGLIFFILFMTPIIVGFFKFNQNYKKYYLLLPILSWLLYGLFHNNLNSSLIWMILGLYFQNVYLFYDKK